MGFDEHRYYGRAENCVTTAAISEWTRPPKSNRQKWTRPERIQQIPLP